MLQTASPHAACCMHLFLLATHHAQKEDLRSVWSVARPCTLLNHCLSLSTKLTSAMGT